MIRLLTKVDDQTYTWDANGNLLSDGTRTFTYDAANRLAKVVSGTITTTFTYNGDGHRVRKVADGVTTTYVVALLGLPHVLAETTGGSSAAYLYGHDLLGEEGAAWAWHLNDGLGSVRQLTDGDGDVELAQGYTPFGVLLWSEGSGASGYGYTGEQEDAAVGLVFLRARYYDPYLGRFISKDPWAGNVWQPGTVNPYAYALNNPLRFVDPTGHCAWCPFAAALVTAYLGGRVFYEVGTLFIPGMDQMRRDRIGGETLARVSRAIEIQSAYRSIDPTVLSAIIRHESAAFERRILTALPSMYPGFITHLGEYIQVCLKGDISSIGPAQMQLRRAWELEEYDYVVTRANDNERIRALLTGNSAVEYAAGMVQFLSDQLHTLSGFEELSLEEQRRLVLIGYNRGWESWVEENGRMVDYGLRGRIEELGFKGVIEKYKYDNETLDEYLRWSSSQ